MARVKSLHVSQRESLSEPGRWPIGLPVGILGGGQLSRMLAEAAARMGLDPRVYTHQADAPAARLGAKIAVGGMKDVETLRQFLSTVSRCVFESEFVSSDMLKVASMGVDVAFFPSLSTMSEFQDKIRQKQCCDALGVPTAPFRVMPETEAPESWATAMIDAFGGECVIKWGRMGYDGKGVFVAGESNAAEAAAFCRNARQQKIPLYAEKKVAFRRELAVIGCLSITGEFKAYPLVVSEQENGVCSRVYGPATALGTSRRLEEAAHAAARRIAEAYTLTGCFGIEFFETAAGELLVNEIAPRVHNSGHYTQDGAATSQFENHWRAVLGLPLGDVRPAPGFAMQNLLGPDGVSLRRDQAALPALPASGHLHWYDKSDIVARRKVGHINGTVDSPDDLPRLLEDLDRSRRDWHDALNRIQRESSND